MSIFTKIKSALVGTGDDRISLLFHSKNKADTVGVLSAYEKSIYINKAIEKRATKVGEIEFVLKKGDIEQEQNPILDLLNNPNPKLSKFQFFEVWQKYKDIFGEVYVWKIKENAPFANSKIAYLELLYPPNVARKYNSEGKIESYVYTSKGKMTSLKPEEVIYDKRPDPRNINNGISLLSAGLKTITNSLEIEDLQYNILKNGGRLDTVISFKDRQRLSNLQSEELREKYLEKYAEAKRTGSPMFLGGEVQVDNLGLSPAELGYLEGKKMTLDDLCILTEVPKALLALTEGSTFNNADMALRTFLKETIFPAQKSIAHILNNNLGLKGFELTIVDTTPENIDEKIKVVESGISKGYITINEARAEFDRDAIPNGDEILVPFSLTPLSSVSNPEPTPTKQKKLVHPLQNYSTRRLYHKMFIKRADKHENKLKKGLISYLDEQRERITEKIGNNIRSLSKADVNDYFNLENEVNLGKDKLMGIVLEIAKESGQSAVELVNGTSPFMLNSEIHSWLDNKTKIFLTHINETTFKTLKDQFSESSANGESYNQLSERIKNTYGNIKTGRADTIARTETNGIMNKSTVEGYTQSGMKIKIWVSVLDGHTRASHIYMDGEEQPINSSFSNGLMFPSDPMGDPAETINCRCSV